MRTDHGKPSNGMLTASLTAVAVALAGLAGAVTLAETAKGLGPDVGDIISFDTRAGMPGDVLSQTVWARNGGRECILDVDTLHDTGGSLIVEARVPGDDPAYRVHWAGRRSSPGRQDCGRAAELTLDDTNLDVLALAAGGWGPVHPGALNR